MRSLKMHLSSLHRLIRILYGNAWSLRRLLLQLLRRHLLLRRLSILPSDVGQRREYLALLNDGGGGR